MIMIKILILFFKYTAIPLFLGLYFCYINMLFIFNFIFFIIRNYVKFIINYLYFLNFIFFKVIIKNFFLIFKIIVNIIKAILNKIAFPKTKIKLIIIYQRFKSWFIIYFKHQNTFIYYNSLKIFKYLHNIYLINIFIILLQNKILIIKNFVKKKYIYNEKKIKKLNQLQVLFYQLIWVLYQNSNILQKYIRIVSYMIFKGLKLIFQTLHLIIHKNSNIYRTCLFFIQYKYFWLILQFIWKQYKKKKTLPNLILTIKSSTTTGVIKTPIKFSLFWYCFTIFITCIVFIIMSGWFSFLYIFFLILNIFYSIFLFFSILCKYLFFNWKNKINFIYLILMSDIIFIFSKIVSQLEIKFNWKKIYVLKKKSYNKNITNKLIYFYYKISFLLLILNINNSVKLAKLKQKQQKYVNTYNDTVYSSIFFKQKSHENNLNVTLSKINTQFLEHENSWVELGILGDNINASHNQWKLSFIHQLTKESNFSFFTKIINHFAGFSNKTWDKFKILNITDTYEDFSFYNEANLRLDHLYGDMSAASEEIGFLKHKKILKNQKKFKNIFFKKLDIKSLFYFKDQNIIGLHKQNKISPLTWKTIYFLLRKHREFQWSAKQLRTVYKIESFNSNKHASLWNTYNNLKYQQISWPLFFSKVLPSIFYTFSFLHDFFFTFFVEFLSDFYTTQLNLFKTAYFIKHSLKISKFNNTMYSIFVTIVIKILWFCLYDVWRILFSLSFKIIWNIKYIYIHSNLFSTILDYSLHWLLYCTQYLKVNNYILTTHLYIYNWNKFFHFKLQSYKFHKSEFKNNYLLFILDIILFLFVFLFLYLLDLCKIILYFFFFQVLSLNIQQILIVIVNISLFLYYNTIYIIIYKIIGFRLYYDMYYNLAYTTKYKFNLTSYKKFHMQRYKLNTDLEGNWLEKDNYTKFILKSFFFFKIINKYWWSIVINNKKGLEGWPFFYNWFKLIPEIKILYDFCKITIFLLYFFGKKMVYYFYDFWVSNLILLYQFSRFLSVKLTLKYIYWFFKIYIFEWLAYGFFFNIFSLKYIKKKSIYIQNNLKTKHFLYNLKYKSTNIFLKYKSSFNKTQSNDIKVNPAVYTKYKTATEAFEELYFSFNKFKSPSRLTLEVVEDKIENNIKLIKSYKYKNNVNAFFFYMGSVIPIKKRKDHIIFSNQIVDVLNSRLLFLNTKSNIFLNYKNKVAFYNLENIWFSSFCKLTNALLFWIQQNKKYYNFDIINNLNLNYLLQKQDIILNKKINNANSLSFFSKYLHISFFNSILFSKKNQLKKNKYRSKKDFIDYSYSWDFFKNWNFIENNNYKFLNKKLTSTLFLNSKNNILLHFFLLLSNKIFQVLYIENIYVNKYFQYIKQTKKTRVNLTLISKNQIRKERKKYNYFYLKVLKKFGFKIFYYMVILYKLLSFFKSFEKNNYSSKSIKKNLKNYSIFYKFKIIKEMDYFFKEDGIKNKIYWKYVFFKDMIDKPTKSIVIEEFLGITSSSQLNINYLIQEELNILEKHGLYNFDMIKKEWKLLNFNYFLFLRDDLKPIFFNKFSTSRVKLNFKILRLLFRNWRLRKRTRKFTSYFLKLFHTSSQAFNITRRKAFAKWHVFDGSNYSGEAKKSYHRLNIKLIGKQEPKTLKSLWYKLIEFGVSYNKQKKKFFKKLKKKIEEIYIQENQVELINNQKKFLSKQDKNITNNFFFKTTNDLFLTSDNIFGKRIFLGIYFDDYLKKHPKWYKWKIKFFFWWNLSWGPYFVLPAIFLLLFSIFGFPFFFSFNVFLDSFLWFSQIIFVFFEQWLSIFYLLPSTVFSNIFLIEWFLVISSILDPFIFQHYFLNINLIFLYFEPVRLCVDIIFLTMNNPYLIDDYSMQRLNYQILLVIIYGFFWSMWKIYLFLTWTIILIIPYLQIFFYDLNYLSYIFFWDFLLNYSQNIFIYSFYSLYFINKINYLTVIFSYTLLINYLWFYFINFNFMIIYYNIDFFTYIYYIGWGDFITNFLFYIFNFFQFDYLHKIYDFIFYFFLYCSLYIHAWIMYGFAMFHLIIFKCKIWFFNYFLFYFEFIFKDFIFKELVEYLLQVWIWFYFNCIYYVIIFPVKFLIYGFWYLIKKIFWILCILPDFSLILVHKFLNLFILCKSILYHQIYLLIKFFYFIIVQPIMLFYTYIINPFLSIFFNSIIILKIISLLKICLSFLSKLSFFPYFIIYKLYFYLGLDFFIFNFWFQINQLYYLSGELFFFYLNFFWNSFSGLWGLFYFITDIVNLFFPEIDKILYPFGGFSILYAAFYYYIFILFAILWSRSFRIFNDTSKEIPVPDYVWEKVRFETEGSKIYSIMPFNLYKLLWIEKLSTNKKGNIPQELLDSLDTWTLREKHASYQLLVRLHDTPFNFQGFYYKYFTDLTRPFVIKYYRQRLYFSTRFYKIIPWNQYKVVFRRLKYAMWVWYVEGYLAYVTDDESDAIYSVGPSPGEVAGREANFDGQFDVLLTNKEIIHKIKRLKLYNFYFMKKTQNNVGIAQDVWLTFPIIGHVFGRERLKTIKAMKNRETFVFEFTPGINQNKSLNNRELMIKKHYIENWVYLNNKSVWKFSTNINHGGTQLYSVPQGKPLDLKADPRFYKLNRYVKVNEDDGINPDFYNDFMYLGSRSLDLFLTPFLTFAAINTAWWNTDNGIAHASIRFLELSNMADVLIKNYLENEFGADQFYKRLRQQFLSAFSSGELRYEFLELDEDDVNLIKYGKPLLDKNLEIIQSKFSSHIFTKFPEIQSNLEDKGHTVKTIKDLLQYEDTHNIIDDILIKIMNDLSINSIKYDRWDSSLQNLFLKEYYLNKEDFSAIDASTKNNLIENIFNISEKQPQIDEFTTNLQNMIIDEMLFYSKKNQWESAFTDKIVAESLGFKVKHHTFGKTFEFKTPQLFDKEVEIGIEVTDKEKWRRIKGASKEKLLEATTANYNLYKNSFISDRKLRGALFNYPNSIYHYQTISDFSENELNNMVFVNFFSDSKPKLMLQKQDLKDLAEFNLIDSNKYLDSNISFRIDNSIRSAPINIYSKPTRFEIEERDEILAYLTNHINDAIFTIENRYLNNENPSLTNLFDECREELLLGKLLFKSTASAPAFGYFLKFYILQRLFSLYITAYENTVFGQLFYYITRSFLVRFPVTGIDVLPLIALDINNNSDIYYTSGFYGLPRVSSLQKEFLMPYTQYTYTQHYLLKSLKQNALMYFTNKKEFLKQFSPEVVNINWNSFPYLHPELDIDKRVRMVYQHIYSASFEHPNIYNEGVYLIKLREIFYFLGVDTWLAEVKDMFTIEKRILFKGWEIINNLVSWDFWIFFFRSDWIIFVEDHSDWFKFTFHVFGYLEREIDLYPTIWYSMHVIEYTKTFLWFLFDITKFIYFPNLTLYYLRFDFWFDILNPFFYNFKLSLKNALAWWYANVWVYRWVLDVSNFFLSYILFKNPLLQNFLYEQGQSYLWSIRFSHLIHFIAYWKEPFNLIPYICVPTFLLTSANILQLNLYKIFASWFIDNHFTIIAPVNKHLVFSFFLTNHNSFLYYNLWYDYYLKYNNITENKQKMFLSKILTEFLNVRYNKKLYPTLLKENIVSPYSFKINYGNYFLTTHEVNLLYNTDFYKKDAIAAYHAFDFLLTKPSNAIYYKNLIEIGDTKDHELGFLFNFQAIYQDLTTVDLSTNILETVTLETFEALKVYEEDLKINNMRLFFYKYFHLIFNHEIIDLSEDNEIIHLIKKDCLKDNLYFTEKDVTWSVMYNKNFFFEHKTGYETNEDNTYFLIKKDINGNIYLFKRIYENS